MKEETIYLFPFCNFQPLHRPLRINSVIAVESSPLRIAGSQNRTWTFWYTLFKIYSFYIALVAGVVRRMLKTRVTLGKIYCALLNLTKTLSVWLVSWCVFSVGKSFDACCVSHKFATCWCLHLCQKWLLVWFVLSVLLERTVKFIITVGIVRIT